MKKTMEKKLVLKKDTVVCLDNEQLAKIQGGETADCQPTEDLTQLDCGKPILW